MQVAGNGGLYALIIVVAFGIITTISVTLVARRLGRNAPRHGIRHSRWFVLPPIIYVTALTIVPFYYLLYVSLLNWNIGFPTITFAFLGNYINTLTNPSFHAALLLSLEIGIGFTAFNLLLGFGIALLLHTPGRLSSFVTTSFILPLMMTPFLIFVIWFGLTTPIIGWFTYFDHVLTGNPGPLFFATNASAILTLLVINTWEWLPFVVVILTAGLRAIPAAPLEAAVIDGAGPWPTFRYVTLPLMRPIVAIVVLFLGVTELSLLDSIQFFTKGGPGDDTSVVSWLIYQTGFHGAEEIGLSAAQSFLFLVVVMAVAGSLMFYIYRGSLKGR